MKQFSHSSRYFQPLVFISLRNCQGCSGLASSVPMRHRSHLCTASERTPPRALRTCTAVAQALLLALPGLIPILWEFQRGAVAASSAGGLPIKLGPACAPPPQPAMKHEACPASPGHRTRKADSGLGGSCTPWPWICRRSVCEAIRGPHSTRAATPCKLVWTALRGDSGRHA